MKTLTEPFKPAFSDLLDVLDESDAKTHTQKEAMEKTYPYYLKNQVKKEVVKVVEERSGFVQFYYVQSLGYGNGGFICRRGFDSTRKDLADCYLDSFSPATENDYIEALKEYYGADKKAREHFIKKYNLK